MKKAGFSVFEIIIIIVVLAIVGAVGYLAYTNFFAKNNDSSATVSPSPQASTGTDTAVKDSSDLDKVDKQLDDLTVDDTDSSQLDSSTSNF